MQVRASDAKCLKTQHYFTKSHVYQMRIATFYINPTQNVLFNSSSATDLASKMNWWHMNPESSHLDFFFKN